MVTSGPSPMEIDEESPSHHSNNNNIKDTPMTAAGVGAGAGAGASDETNKQLSEEEEARQAIEKLRGEDLSARVEAAYKLETVAKTLGEERTRDVSDKTS